MKYFVNRHHGAIAWAKQHLNIDVFVSHLDVKALEKGDEVYGTLPVNLAAKCCKKGARYFHLSLEVPETLRGQELSEAQMEQLQATIQEYEIKEL